MGGSYSDESSIDKGWAWMIMLGAVLWNVTVSGTLKSFGVLYIEFMDVFDTGPSETSWIGFVFCVMMIVFSPLAGYIGDMFPSRWILLVGGVVAASGVILTAFATSVPQAIIFYGVIAGGAIGIMDGPVFGTLNKYFKKKRAFANSIAFVGSGIGCFIMPIVLTLCIEEYTIRGTMLILGGLWLHPCVIGALFRSIRFDIQTIDVVKINNDCGTHEGIHKSPIESKYVVNVEEECNSCSLHNAITDELHVMNGECFLSLTYDTPNTNLNFNNVYKQLPLRDHNENKNKSDHMANGYVTKSTTSDSIAGSTENPHISVQNPADKVVSLNSFPDNTDNKTYTAKHNIVLKAIKDYVYFLNNPSMVRILLAVMFGSIAYFNQMFLFPALAKEIHMSKMQGALLVSLPGITEICSRIPLGYCSDKAYVNKQLLVSVLSVISFMTGFCVSFLPNEYVFYSHALLLGVIGGTTVPLAMPMLANVVPTENISSAAGLFLGAMSVAFAIGPPVLGAVKTWSGSYMHSFRLCVTMYLPAALLLLWDVISNYYSNKIKCTESIESTKDTTDLPGKYKNSESTLNTSR